MGPWEPLAAASVIVVVWSTSYLRDAGGLVGELYRVGCLLWLHEAVIDAFVRGPAVPTRLAGLATSCDLRAFVKLFNGHSNVRRLA